MEGRQHWDVCLACQNLVWSVWQPEQECAKILGGITLNTSLPWIQFRQKPAEDRAHSSGTAGVLLNSMHPHVPVSKWSARAQTIGPSPSLPNVPSTRLGPKSPPLAGLAVLLRRLDENVVLHHYDTASEEKRFGLLHLCFSVTTWI